MSIATAREKSTYLCSSVHKKYKDWCPAPLRVIWHIHRIWTEPSVKKNHTINLMDSDLVSFRPHILWSSSAWWAYYFMRTDTPTGLRAGSGGSAMAATRAKSVWGRIPFFTLTIKQQTVSLGQMKYHTGSFNTLLHSTFSSNSIVKVPASLACHWAHNNHSQQGQMPPTTTWNITWGSWTQTKDLSGES